MHPSLVLTQRGNGLLNNFLLLQLWLSDLLQSCSEAVQALCILEVPIRQHTKVYPWVFWV